MGEPEDDGVDYLVELFGSAIGPFSVRVERDAVADEILLACPPELDEAGSATPNTTSEWTEWTGANSGPSWCLRPSGYDRVIEGWTDEELASFEDSEGALLFLISG